MPGQVKLLGALHSVLREVVLVIHRGCLPHERAMLAHACKRALELVSIRKAGGRPTEGPHHALLVHLANEVALIQEMVIEGLPTHARALKQLLDRHALERHALILYQREQRIYDDTLNVYSHD